MFWLLGWLDWVASWLVLLIQEILQHLGCIKPLVIMGCLPYQLVQDFSHQQYFTTFSIFLLADVQERADARGVTPLLAAAGFCGSSLLVKLLLDAKVCRLRLETIARASSA